MCFTFELIQALHALNDKENCKGFYNSVYPGEAKMCLDFMSFRAPPASLKHKKLSQFPINATNYNQISGAILVYKTSPFDYRFVIIKRLLSLL